MNKFMRVAAVVGALGFGAMIGCSSDDDPGKTEPDPACNESGHACTWLGVPGATAFTKDGSGRLTTEIYWTMDTLFASDGRVWFIDWNNHLVRKVDAEGTITSAMGWNDPVFPGDGDPTDPKAEYSATGAPGTDVQLNHPTDLVELKNGTILVMAWHNHKLRSIDPATGTVKVLGGAGQGFKGDNDVLSKALFKQPSRLALDENENIYILDQQNQRIRHIDAATQIVTTVVGTGVQGFAGDDGPALQAQLSFEIGDNPEPSGGLAYAANTLYIADTENNRIRKVDLATSTITTIAGTGEGGFSGDGGPAKDAKLWHPRDLELGPDGDLYIADTDNSRVRAIDLATGTIRTIAGTNVAGYDPASEGKLATETSLRRPFGVDFDPSGNLYISDSLNSRILRVAK